jgi:diaminopimelate decarboxylase
MYLAYKSSRWVRWQGISAHIGSQILSAAPFGRAVLRVAGFVRGLAREGIPLKYFDFGGGVGIRYAREEPLRLRDYARVIAGAVRPLGCCLLLEPGRVLVGPAGVVLMRVLYTKRSGGKNFVVVDGAMNDFLRPALYRALHPITCAGPAGKHKVRGDIVGPVCETADCFLADWPMEDVKPGALLVLWGTGAYGFVSATNYNSRPRPAEVLVEGRRFRVIRRRESRAELVRGE